MGVLDTLKGTFSYDAEQADADARDADSMFPTLDRGARHLTEATLENEAFNARERFAGEMADAQATREEIAAAKDGDLEPIARRIGGNLKQQTQPASESGSREDYQEKVDDWNFDERRDDAGLIKGAAYDEVGRFHELQTGVTLEGEQQTTGIGTASAPLWWAGGPITRGAGAATRGGASAIQRMANTGTLTSARQSMSRAATYMPGVKRPIGGAPARSNAQEGVKGAGGSIVRKTDDLTTSVGNRLDAIPFGRTMAAVGGGGAALGGAGSVMAGGADNVSIEVADRRHDPNATIVELRDADSSLGYVVVFGSRTPQSGDNVSVITPGGGARNVGFPPKPHFHSMSEARTAYDEYNKSTNDPPSTSDGPMDMGPYDEPTDDWEEASHSRGLAGGWHLYRQDHLSEPDRDRWVVCGYRNDGKLLYLDGDVESHTSFAAFKERASATATHQEWMSRLENGDIPSSKRPDPEIDRPSPAEVGGTDTTGVLGMTVETGTLVRLGTIATAVAIGLILYGRL